jgi:uncharacterized SAM-binding protein YcdF (DUF218 family)
MFFILSKILYFIITPVFWILVLLVLLLFVKNHKSRKKLILSGLFLFIFFTNNLIFNLIVGTWESETKKFAGTENHYKYSVVLGGFSSGNTESGVIQFSPGVDRLLEAIALYKKGKIEKILITSGSGAVLNQKNKEADFLYKVCLDIGIPDSGLIIENESRNTHENAIFTKKIIGTDSKILLITSGFHMRRAAACFRHEGFTFDSLCTDPLKQMNMGPDDFIVPKVEPLYKWSVLIREWIGYIAYKIAGYI